MSSVEKMTTRFEKYKMSWKNEKKKKKKKKKKRICTQHEPYNN